MSDLLRKLVDESRQDLGAREVRGIDWTAVDRELFARLEQERRLERTRAVGPRAPAWGVGAAVLAAAACLALVAGKAHDTRALDAPQAPLSASAPAAGTVVAVLGSGELLVDGKPVTTGATLRLGNVVETRGTSVTVERPGKLSMILEAGTHATVTHVQGALVLALDTGAVEAQVVPVASGEAFAVDVGGSRVAVHGTHLRVARQADQVQVDLNEGVVIVGSAPREGSTVGTLVTAPAHADFAAPDLGGTLHVTHEAAAVRAPNGIAATPSTMATGVMAPAPAVLPTVRPEPRPSPAPAAPVVRPSPGAVTAAATGAPAPSVPAPDPNAAGTLAAAVRACVHAHTRAENATVVVNTTLHLDLDAEGSVKAARFEPPVAPDVNTCAAAVIYRTRFAHDGTADVAVDVKVPASAP
jgi:ferric-dicitrate binding protein FerR (iron transport regulator)